MRRLLIAGIAVALAFVGFGSTAHAQAPEIPPVPPEAPGAPGTPAPPEPGVSPSQPDPGDPTQAPGDPQGYLCTLTGNLLDWMDAEDPTGEASQITTPLREQHAGFCAGDGGGDDDDPLAPLKEALCPVIDTVIAEAGANGAPAELIGVVTTVREAIGCPVVDDGGGGGPGSGGGGSSGEGADGPDGSEVLGGGAQAAGSGGPLPRTGADLLAPLGMAVTALSAALRRLVLR